MRVRIFPEATKALECVGYFLNSEGGGGKKWYRTPKGTKSVWLYQRSHRGQGRYPIGISPLAMRNSNEIILWASAEEHLFILPSVWLLAQWEEAGSLTSRRGQFYFDLWWRDGGIENPRLNIMKYSFSIPENTK
jgi:hypothetical protein